MSIDPKEFRAALGSFATGVTIVTTHSKGGITEKDFSLASEVDAI